MKTKRLVSAILAASLAATAAISVSAIELTNLSPDGNTEVTAKIEGTAGEVTYIITVPDKIDFGTLTQPTENVDSYKEIDYTVTATKVEGLDSNQYVSVYARDFTSSTDDTNFYITQKDVTDAFSLQYDLFSDKDDTDPVNIETMGTNGYHIASFKTAGETITGKIRLNQKQLYGKDLNTIAGDYSGYITFHSEITTSVI